VSKRKRTRTSETVAEALPALAAEHGLSLRAVARGIQANPSHVIRIVAGENPASGPYAARIAELFELPADYFPEYRQWRVEEAVRADPEFRDRLYDRLAIR
jgi:hypothetical protein